MYLYILVDFLHKAYSKVDFGCVKISDAIFLGQSLLLCTTVLNDMYLLILKIKDLKTTNRDRKKSNQTKK